MLCYQMATPDIAISPEVTAYQGDLDQGLSALSALGYNGVEFMTLAPDRLDVGKIEEMLSKYGLSVPLICTGEIFGQLQYSFADPDADVRGKAVERLRDIVDFASRLGANVNIGRVRGHYSPGVPKERTYRMAVEALREICDYAAPKGVQLAIETVTIMQTNFINTLEEAALLLHAVGRRNCRLMMDVFHMNLEEKDLLEAIRKYAELCIHVHLADNNRRYPGNCGLDFRKILSAFHEVGYSGAFCTEIFQIPDQDSAAKGAIEHLAPIISEIYG